MTSRIINVRAEIEENDDQNLTRYTFTLYGGSGDSMRELIVDVPNEDGGTTDVWVLNSIVAVGDTPEDGFATFTPLVPLTA